MTRRRKAPLPLAPGVRSVPVTTRQLTTVDPMHPAWSKGSAELSVKQIAGAGGGIVRLIPPPEATDAQVNALKAELLGLGCAAVKVVPRAAGVAVVARPEAPLAALPSLIEVALDLAAKARSQQPDRLRALVEQSILRGEA